MFCWSLCSSRPAALTRVRKAAEALWWHADPGPQMGLSVPQSPRLAAGDMRDGAVPVAGPALGKGGSGTAASPRLWLCPTISRARSQMAVSPQRDTALPPGNATPAWQWWLCSNDTLWFSYAANYPQLCLLMCSSSPQRSFSKWLYFYFIFIDLLAMLRGEWTGIQGFK